MDEDPDWSESLDIMKQENPWDVISIFDLAYFCCPECDFKHQGKQDFVSHASNNHPWVSLPGVLLGRLRAALRSWIAKKNKTGRVRAFRKYFL